MINRSKKGKPIKNRQLPVTIWRRISKKIDQIKMIIVLVVKMEQHELKDKAASGRLQIIIIMNCLVRFRLWIMG